MKPDKYQPSLKRTRCTNIHSMEESESESAETKLSDAKERFGRKIRVFETTTAYSSTASFRNNGDDEPDDDFYELTAEDYYRLMANNKKEDKYLKTRKIREAEEAARRSRATNNKPVMMRVRFPDNYTLEAAFHPSETIQSLFDLLKKVINQPEVPFYVYTTPPKCRLKNPSQDFYSAGFVPGAIVYFAYDLTNPDATDRPSGPYLLDEVMSLQGLEVVDDKKAETCPNSESVIPNNVVAAKEAVPKFKPAEKKTALPKWFKLW